MTHWTDEEVEKVARAICVAERMNDDDVLGGWRHWVHAARAALAALPRAPVRDAVVEECARVVEVLQIQPNDQFIMCGDTLELAAKRIRALKSPPLPSGGGE